jgi:entericidin B
MARSVIRAAVVTIAGVVLFAGLAGCNTVKGAGEDVQTGGEKVKEAAESVQEKLK